MLSGCGSDGTRVVAERPGGIDALSGLAGEATAISVASGGGGVAVVQGGWGAGTAPAPRLTWAGTDGQPLTIAALPISVPLANISTWWTGSEVAVFGLPCPAWTEELSPEWGDGIALNVICGNDAYRLLTWSPTTGRWRLHESLDFTARDGATVSSVAGPRALVTAGFQTTGTQVVIDSTDGSVTELPDALFTGGGAENAFQACLSDGRVLALLEWQADAPPTIPGADLVRSSGAGADERHLLALTVEDGRWNPVPIDDAIAPAGPGTRLLCTNGGLFDASGDVPALLSLVGEEVQVDPLPELPAPVEGDVLGYAPDAGLETVIAIATPMGLRAGAEVDAPRTSKAWILEDGDWSVAGAVRYGGAWRGLVVDGRIVALAERSASAPRYVLEVQLP